MVMKNFTRDSIDIALSKQMGDMKFLMNYPFKWSKFGLSWRILTTKTELNWYSYLDRSILNVSLLQYLCGNMQKCWKKDGEHYLPYEEDMISSLSHGSSVLWQQMLTSSSRYNRTQADRGRIFVLFHFVLLSFCSNYSDFYAEAHRITITCLNNLFFWF